MPGLLMGAGLVGPRLLGLELLKGFVLGPLWGN